MTGSPTAARSAGRLILTLVVAALACAGCIAPGGIFANVASVTPAASSPPAPSVEPSAVASVEDSEIPFPPEAALAVDGGDPVVGELGSFTWDNTGSDSPWLPGTPIRVGRGEVLFMALSEPVRLTDWAVARTSGGTPGAGIEGVAEGIGGMVRFPAPPSGLWSVSVDVWFADGLGSASYYWLIDVD